MFNLIFKKILLVILCVLLFSIGCQSSPVTKPQEAEEDVKHDYAEMRPQIRNLDELTIAFSKHDIELDFRKSYFATEAQIFTGLYEGLFSYHPLTLEPVPAVAERWELSDDKKQWTFTIRRTARFWNGTPVRSEDFRAAWISLLAPERESPYSGLFDVIEGARDYRNGIDTDPGKVGILAPNERTLIVKLNSPASFFPAMLCHHSFSPIHHSMVDTEDWSKELPVSNGPYRVTSFDDGSLVMQKNERYWDAQRVALNKITIKFTDTADEATHLWNSGEARWIAGDVNIEGLTDRSGIQVNIMFATHYYFIRSEGEPWNDHRVRRAMALVLPWEEIRGRSYLPAETLIFPISGYPEIKGISEADYEEAERLIAEAGLTAKLANGKDAPELVLRLTPSREAERVGALMAAAWKEKLGFNVRVEVIPYDRYFQSMKEDGYTIGSSSWIGDFADPYTFLQMWRRDSNLNDARLDDEDFEKLIERSMLEEGDVRMATLAEAEKLLLDRGVVLPISYSPALNIVDTGELEGWYPNALDIHPFKYFSFRGYRPLPGIAMTRHF
ncbi:MAG: peptide ABC transporter substrate-binding protein [Treponema sp.]|jgi:peptide/nickel transport system substrate-binding protein/oligopeptide transport system substrate-binding protein|nr:peptide ABC transporter substrate-binding protein [Treponema sp.]